MQNALSAALKQSGKSCLFIFNDTAEAKDGRGVSPLLELYRAYGDSRAGCRIADVVVGKAAASIMILLGAKEVYGEVMSEPAKALLDKYGVDAEYGKLVPLIRNRTNDGFCPLEMATGDAETPAQALQKIEEFLNRPKA